MALHERRKDTKLLTQHDDNYFFKTYRFILKYQHCFWAVGLQGNNFLIFNLHIHYL